MNTFTIKLFGPMGRAVGQREIKLSIDADRVTCAELRAWLSKCEPRLASLLPACRLAVNCQFAIDDQPITQGDEIALIGFVSGG
ncbi:MAG: MoaD/ThiS family protein [Thermoguttaceae bacterium]